MKNSIKLIAAAALVATSGFASAAIDTGATGNGELFFRAYDSTTTQAYFFDTGLSFASFTPAAATNQTFSLTNFASFLSTVTASTTVWGVYGTDNAAPTGFYTTAVSAISTNPKLSNISNINGRMVNAANLANIAAGNADTALNNNSVVTGASTATSGFLDTGLNFTNNLAGGKAAGTLDETSLLFYGFDKGTVANSTRTQFANAAGAATWNLNTTTGTLSFVTATAPVPEPSTYALAIAGLAVVGALARRKKAAK
jgi:hypothetical protein